jgi:hypothetical protein
MSNESHRLTLYDPAFYRIRIQGVLDESWAEELGMGIGWIKEIGRGPVTILKGEVLDQAALVGLLNRLYGLGLPLVSVEWVRGHKEG